MSSGPHRLRIGVPILTGLSCLVLLPIWFLVAAAILGLEAILIFRTKSRRAGEENSARDTTKASLIVLNWNGRQLLEENMPSILAAAWHDGGGHEVLLVDNGSGDDSVAWVRANLPEVKILELGRNLQFARANNRAAEAAANEMLVFLNNDVRVEPDFIRPLLEGLQAPDVFAVACCTRLMAAPGTGTDVSRTIAQWQHGRWSTAHEPLSVAHEEEVFLPIAWACGGMCAVERRKFLSLGGFDSLFSPFYYEDFDLSYQAWKRGWRVLLATRSLVHHHHQGSIGRLPPRYVRTVIQRNALLAVWKGVSDLRALVEHFIWWPAIIFRAVEQLGVVGTAAAFLGAFVRLPAVLLRRWFLRTYLVRTDNELRPIVAGASAVLNPGQAKS